jgi:hypothetical protein
MFWSITRSHQSDIGAATHGGYNPGATGRRGLHPATMPRAGGRAAEATG